MERKWKRKRKRPSVYLPLVMSCFLALCRTRHQRPALALPSPPHPSSTSIALGQLPQKQEMLCGAHGPLRGLSSFFNADLAACGDGSLRSGPSNQHTPQGGPQCSGRGQGWRVLQGASGPRRSPEGEGPAQLCTYESRDPGQVSCFLATEFPIKKVGNGEGVNQTAVRPMCHHLPATSRRSQFLHLSHAQVEAAQTRVKRGQDGLQFPCGSKTVHVPAESSNKQGEISTLVPTHRVFPENKT